MTRRWLSWKDAPAATLQNVRGICFDVDDTFSTRGKITPEAFDALWRAYEAGYVLVPVTGRPAGWCDHFARFWPVHAVIGENGAFSFFMQDGVRKRHNTPMQWTHEQARAKLAALQEEILKKFPHALWSSDQAYREYDLAIDVYEDVEPWPDADVEALMRMCEDAGAEVKLSSVHVNVWYGDYNKYAGFQHWLAQGARGAPANTPHDPAQWIYMGDSPNDDPMFACFENSVGVANVLPFKERMACGPTWVTEGEGGAGFSEVIRTLLEEVRS